MPFSIVRNDITKIKADALLSAGVDADEHDMKEKLIYSMKYWGRKYPHAGYSGIFWRKAEVIAAAAGVTLGELVSIDYSWGEIDFVTRPVNEMMLKCCDASLESEEPNGYDIDIEANDIDVTDTVTIVWNIA